MRDTKRESVCFLVERGGRMKGERERERERERVSVCTLLQTYLLHGTPSQWKHLNPYGLHN